MVFGGFAISLIHILIVVFWQNSVMVSVFVGFVWNCVRGFD